MVPPAPLRGGLTLPKHKESTRNTPLRDAALPPQLVFPLFRGSEHRLIPIVAAGDYVLKGQAIAICDDGVSPPLHASSSGVVVAIEHWPLPHPSGLDGPCIIVATDGLDRALPFRPVPDYRELAPAELRRRLFEAGIAIPDLSPMLVLDGTESEPYPTADEAVMRHHPEQVIGGGEMLMHALGADACTIAVGGDMPHAIAALRGVLPDDDSGAMRIVPVPAIYPVGHARLLVPLLTGREPGAPGVAFDGVATAAAVFRAVAFGEPLITRIVTVTGNRLAQPRNFTVRIGTPVADLIAQCGGHAAGSGRLVLGGAMTGFALTSDAVPVDLAVCCVRLDGTESGAHDVRPVPCTHCGACAEVCPVALLPQPLYAACRSDELDRAEELGLADCITCACCDAVCPSHIPLTGYFRAAQSLIQARVRERARAQHARRRFEAHEARRQREQRAQAERADRQRAVLQRPGAEAIAQAIARAKARKQAQAAPAPAAASSDDAPKTGTESGNRQRPHTEG